jgi:hypothetical protein
MRKLILVFLILCSRAFAQDLHFRDIDKMFQTGFDSSALQKIMSYKSFSGPYWDNDSVSFYGRHYVKEEDVFRDFLSFTYNKLGLKEIIWETFYEEKFLELQDEMLSFGFFTHPVTLRSGKKEKGFTSDKYLCLVQVNNDDYSKYTLTFWRRGREVKEEDNDDY